MIKGSNSTCVDEYLFTIFGAFLWVVYYTLQLKIWMNLLDRFLWSYFLSIPDTLIFNWKIFATLSLISQKLSSSSQSFFNVSKSLFPQQAICPETHFSSKYLYMQKYNPVRISNTQLYWVPQLPKCCSQWYMLPKTHSPQNHYSC